MSINNLIQRLYLNPHFLYLEAMVILVILRDVGIQCRQPFGIDDFIEHLYPWLTADAELQIHVPWPVSEEQLIPFVQGFNIDAPPVVLIEELRNRIFDRMIGANVYIEAIRHVG